MPELYIGFAGIGVLFLLILLRVPIGIACAFLGFVGMIVIIGWDATLSSYAFIPFLALRKYTLSVLPLFIFLGALASVGGIGRDVFTVVRTWVGGFRAGLPLSAIGGCGAFAAITGSSVSTVAAMGRVAYPELKRNEVDLKLTCGVIICSGTFAILIPPSNTLIYYALFTETSVGPLLIAGILPGIITVLTYGTAVLTMVKRKPSLCPTLEKHASWRDKISTLPLMLPVGIIFGFIMGGIYFGLTTPTEAASVGVTALIILLVISRRLSLRQFFESLRVAATVFVSVGTIILGAFMFIPFLSYTGVTVWVTETLIALPVSPYVVLAGITVLYLILGTFLDAIAMLAITLPVTFPVIVSIGFSPIWYGIYIVKLVEIALVTPPLGMCMYVFRSIVPDSIPLNLIFKSIIPFLLCDLFVMGLLVAFPGIPLFLLGLRA